VSVHLVARVTTLLRVARLACVEGHRVAVFCADDRRQAELRAEYRRLYPQGPAPEFITPGSLGEAENADGINREGMAELGRSGHERHASRTPSDG
jgi:hypothetical protein